MTLNYPDNIEQKIDFAGIRSELRQACDSALGRHLVDEITFLSEFATIRSLLAETSEFKRILEDNALDFPRGEIVDLEEAISRIRIEGLFLDEAELFSLRKTLDYAYRLEVFFHSLDVERFPLWQSFTQGIATPIAHIVRDIDKVLDKYGQLADTASPELARIRHELVLSQGSVARALSSILRKAQAEGLLDKDVSPTIREGRLVLPIPPAYKHKIGGIVHDESATGKTIFVEPQQVVEANNKIRELEGEERRERVRILQQLTMRLQPDIAVIKETQQMLAKVDFVRAKVRVAQALNAIAPEIVERPLIDWAGARHPMMYLNFKKQKKEVVPLDICLQSDRNRILVISGPNAGGKSVCLKTVALVQYMVQCGLLVPIAESSTMGVFRQMMIDIGDEQSIEDDLSTYSSHLRNMKAFVRYADAQTLLLIDEFGTGTEPLLGGAIAEAVLRQLSVQRAFGVITTHYTNLKHFAEQTDGVVNGAMLYDRGRLQPLFQLSIGQAGSSFAIEIARQTGLPETIIQDAIGLIGEEHIDYDKQLQDIARDKRYWENKRQNIRQREKHLEEKIAFYETEIAGLKAKKKEVMAQAKEEAASLLEESNAAIERTIREIKEAKADKEKTRQARARLEHQKAKIETAAQPVKVQQPTESKSKQPKVLRDFRDLKPMAKAMNQTTSNRPTSGTIADTIRRRKLAFERTLDLRGMRADEALETVIAYIDDAIMVGADEVTILHGTGTGALKQVVRAYLEDKNHQMRKHGSEQLCWHDGDPDRGGAGLTIVEIQ
ncbi:MAG: Smr/MutS family protein [Paludibacteraceae bacterium]|nr:Smr/MutS family protein [Paludibacteraceae bacterium]